VLVTAALLSFMGIVAIVTLLPAYFTLQMQKSSLLYEISGLTKTGGLAAVDTNSVSATNKRMRAMRAVFAQPNMLSVALLRVVQSRPKGMSIEHLSYDPAMGTTTAHILTVSGVLARPADQSLFITALKGEKLFSQVEIPISTLTHSDKSALTLVLHGTF
jgi:hypothetical protein